MPLRDWNRLVVPMSEVDPARVLGFWDWLVDRPVGAVELTRFGDWFVADAAGIVYRLDALDGSFTPICNSIAEYQHRKSSLPELDEWFSEATVDALHQAGHLPGAGQGFGYRVPPIIGGPVNRENIVVVELTSWQLFISNVHQAVNALPAGSRVTRMEVQSQGRIKLHTEQ